MSRRSEVGCTTNIYGIWLLMFVIVKVGGTAMAAWSWWWLLFPVVPDLVILLRKIGVMG